VVSASLVLAPTTGLNLRDGAGCRERALQNGAMAAEVRAPPEEEWEEAPTEHFRGRARRRARRSTRRRGIFGVQIEESRNGGVEFLQKRRSIDEAVDRGGEPGRNARGG